MPHAAAARRTGTRIQLAQILKWECGPKIAAELLGVVGRAVVHHNHLKDVRRDRLAREGIETLR
ncbi:MAG: hypothetical protein WB707_00825 [Candidatus Acidiferrales bacterium]